MIKCQQYELYAAEANVPQGHWFSDADEMQRFVTNLRDTWWWSRWYPNVQHVEVHALPKSARSSVGGYFPNTEVGSIEMLPVHFNELYVLHELAHVLAKARWNSTSHDPLFARVYLELVSLVMGSETYVALDEAFTYAGIEKG